MYSIQADVKNIKSFNVLSLTSYNFNCKACKPRTFVLFPMSCFRSDHCKEPSFELWQTSINPDETHLQETIKHSNTGHFKNRIFYQNQIPQNFIEVHLTLVEDINLRFKYHSGLMCPGRHIYTPCMLKVVRERCTKPTFMLIFMVL